MSEFSTRPDPTKVEPESGTPVSSGSMQGNSTGDQQSMTDQAKEKATEYGERAQEQAEQTKEQAAGGMERAAGMIRERSGSMDGTAAQAGTKVAESMETAAGYMKEHTTTEMWEDLEHYAKQHPGQALAGAVLTGFLLGRILR